jgi:predicted nucleic acid-binding protein
MAAMAQDPPPDLDLPDLDGHSDEVRKRPIYLDACALLRPYDDLGQPRVRREAEAVALVLAHVRAGRFVLVVSPTHQQELPALAEGDEAFAVRLLLERFGRPTTARPVVLRRAREWMARGLGVADAAHLAFAEAARADFVSCDDRLLRRASRSRDARVWLGDPVAFCLKEDLK